MTTEESSPEQGPDTAPERGPLLLAIRTVGVPVTDQDRSLDFYVGTLGMTKQLDAALDELGARWIEVAPRDGGTTVALVLAGDQLPSGVETGLRLTTDDAAALHRHLHDLGVGVGELLNWPGVPPMFAFRDPDGNGLEIVQSSEPGRQPVPSQPG